MLKITDLHTYYGSVHALKGISMQVEDGKIVTLVGSNGAGKSSTLNTISGLVHPRSGSIMLDDTDISKLSDYQIVERGRLYVVISNSVELGKEKPYLPREDTVCTAAS